jgi:UDP-GlcNAc:undecaprenyl-phosphate/decaprenyl-phosphate GlcNAc-1-phosphate transferase
VSSTIGIDALLAFAVTMALVPVAIRASVRWRIFDRPGPLKIHSRPTSRLGGVAIVLAIALSSFLASPREALRIWPFFAALAIVWIASLIDDVRSLSAAIRLVAQISAALILWFGGWHAPWPHVTNHAALNAMAMCLIVIVFVNSLNFLDGADGVAAGVAALISVGYAAALWPLHEPGAAVIAVSAVAGCLGFLIYNFPAPAARIFMGDTGSASLGLILAFLALSFWRSAPITATRTVFPLLIAALPLLDAALAILRRLWQRRSPLFGDRAHFCDLLRAKHISAAGVAFICYGVTLIFVTIACLSLRSNSVMFWIAATAAVILFLLVSVRLGSLRRQDSTPVITARKEMKVLAGFGRRVI